MRKRHLLLAVIGLSPQVLTEAIYALFAEGRPVDAVHCITTARGRAEILNTLLAPRNSPLDDFCRQYGVDRKALDFGPESVELLYRQGGEPMDDIASEEDNAIVLRACLEAAHRYTADPGTVVSFLVAGGRKTMTSCLTLAAQCYGRSCDRIYHVLVSPEFEGCRSFWFPPREPEHLELRNERGEPFFMSTASAQVTLVPIPFFSARDLLDPALLDRPREPADLLQSLVRSKPESLEVLPDEGKVRYGRMEADLPPACMALYLFFVERKLACPRASCGSCRDCWLEVTELVDSHADRIAGLYRSLPMARTFDGRGEGSIVCLSKEAFRSFKAKINQRLRACLGQKMAAEAGISRMGRRPDSRYGISLDKSRMRVDRFGENGRREGRKRRKEWPE